jgi:similar to stage IV sporulation protein
MGIEGLSLGKLIRHALSEGIVIRSLKRHSHTRMEMELTAREYRRFLAISGEYRVSVRPLECHGFPFLFRRAVGRLGLLAGLLALIGVLSALSQFILVVDIIGTDDHALVLELRDTLAEQGIYPGAYKKGVDVDAAEKAALRRLDALSHVGIRIRGMRVTAEAIPKVPVPDMVDRSAPCHLVARVNAIVSSIHVMDGQAVVEIGDTVTAGQMLVSGQVTLADGEVRLRHALATVMGRVWYRGEAARSMLLTTTRYTGSEFGSARLLFPGGQWTLREYGEAASYESHETATRRIPLLGEGFLLPIWLEDSRVRETVEDIRLLDFEQILAAATDEAVANALLLIPEDARVVDQSSGYRIDGDGILTVEVFVETEEEISVEAPFTP